MAAAAQAVALEVSLVAMQHRAPAEVAAAGILTAVQAPKITFGLTTWVMFTALAAVLAAQVMAPLLQEVLAMVEVVQVPPA
jgi:hypothetical protein